MLLRNRSQKVELLKGVPLFASMTQKQLAEVARHADEVHVEGGHILALEGTVGKELFIIVAGTASVTKHDRVLATLGPGDFVGEMALLDGEPRSATVVADEPMTVLNISSREFEPLLLHMPAIALRMLKAMAHRLRDTDEALSH